MDAEHSTHIESDEFRTVITTSLDGFLIVAVTGQILEANDSYCRMIGYSREELIHMHISEVDAIESTEDVSKRIEEVVQRGALRFETRHRHKNGSTIEIEVCSNYSPAHDGVFFSFIRDITEHKRTRGIIDARLRLMEFSINHSIGDLLRETLDEVEKLTGSCIGFYHFLDSDQQMITLQAWSTRTATHFCKAEGTGSHYHISQAGVWVDCVRERRAVIHNDYASLPHRKGMPEGHATVIRELVVPVFRKGTIVAILGIGNKTNDYDQRDVELVTLFADLAFSVVEHKQSEASNLYYSEIMKNMTEGVFLIRCDTGTITFANPKIENMFGYESGELVGKDVSIVNAPSEKTPDETKKTIMDILAKTGEWHGEVENVKKDGTHFWCYANVSIFDSSEHGKVFVSVHTDITERKRSEMALIESETRFKTVTMASTDGIILQERGGKILVWNIAAERIFGISASEVIGQSSTSRCWKTYNEDGILLKGEEHPSMRTLASGKPCVNVIMRVERDNGEFSWISVNTNPLFKEGELLPEAVVITFNDITERRQAEFALQKLSTEMQRVLETSATGLTRCSRDLYYLSANTAYANLAGVPREQIVGKPIVEVMGEEGLAAIMPYVVRVLHGERVEYETSVPFQAGGDRYLHVIYTPDEDEHGDIIGWVASITDITERKKSEEALLESEKRYRLLSETMLQGVVYQDANGTVIAMNPAAERILGKSCDEFLGSSSVKVEHHTIRENGERFPGVEHPSMVALRTGQSVSAIIMGVYNPKLDEYRWISIGAVPVFRPGEASPSEVFAVFDDVTERKRSEERVRESEHRFRSLFDEMTEGVALHDVIRDDSGTIANYRIQMVNPAFTVMLGLPPEAVTGKLATEAYGIDTPPYLKEFSEVALSKKALRFTTYFPQMDKHFEISAIPWELDGFATIFLDISTRIKAEESQRLQAGQLQQTQRLESLGVLAGGIAHDFNNILAIIMGHCSLTEMNYEKAPDHIPEIEKAVARAAELCRQMLAYAGKAQFVQAQVNVGELVEEMVKMLKSTIKQNVVITPSIATDIPFIKADASQMSQIVMNLIINGAEAIGDAQGEVHVALSKISIKTGQSEKDYLGKLISAGWYACLEVTDNGCGMSDETYNRIFEPFYTTKFTGRGLGMSAVLGIVTAQGGALQLVSQQGIGTTFKVYLPLQISDTAAEEPQKLVNQPESWLGSGTILLVEDEDQILQVAKAMIMELGFRVIEARNGKEAIEQYQKNASDINLVLTDMGMPVMDGYALINELKKRNPALPMIISSGFGDADITARISRDNIAGLIGKPYNFNLLRNVLKSVMEGTSKKVE